MKVIRIKAVEGRRVRDPNTEQPLTHEAHGARKPFSSYWQRRLAAGDVVEVFGVQKPATETEKVNHA